MQKYARYTGPLETTQETGFQEKHMMKKKAEPNQREIHENSRLGTTDHTKRVRKARRASYMKGQRYFFFIYI